MFAMVLSCPHGSERGTKFSPSALKLTAFRGSRRVNSSLTLNTCHYGYCINGSWRLVGLSQHLHTKYLRTCMNNSVLVSLKEP